LVASIPHPWGATALIGPEPPVRYVKGVSGKAPELKARYGMVIVLDALGTRALWAADEKEGLLGHRVALRDFIRKKVTDFEVPTHCTRPDSAKPFKMVTVETRVQFISDTLIVSFNPKSTVAACLLFSYAFDLVTGIILEGIRHHTLFRGAISVGHIYTGEDFLMGKAVDEAAEWHELADWAGVMLTPMAGEQMDRIVRAAPGVPPFGYLRWEVPASRSRGVAAGPLGDAWVVAWPWYAKALRRELELLFLEPPVSPSVNLKFQNTMKFFDYLWSGRASMNHHFIEPGSYTDRFLSESDAPKELFAAWAKEQKAKKARKGGRKPTASTHP
jgi:hypothetical protein